MAWAVGKIHDLMLLRSCSGSGTFDHANHAGVG